MRDFFGNEFRVGQEVLHVGRSGSTMYFERRTVSRVEGDKLWIRKSADSRDTPVHHPHHLVINPASL